MKRYKVIVTDDRFGSYQEEKKVLDEINAELIVYNCKNDEELIKAAGNADGILLNLYPLNQHVIKHLNGCKVISRYGVGYDNVNVEAATEAGIWVSIVPDYGIDEASDHALGLLLALIRQIPLVHTAVKKEEWNLQNRIKVPRTRGKVMGIVGYGRIGRALHRKVAGFGFSKVLIADPYISPGEIVAHNGIPANMEDLLKEADFISVHVCLNQETRHLIGERELKIMKQNAILINTSRGALIDEKSLCEALEAKRIAGAGLDVFEKEPISSGSPLLKLENVLLSSHMAYYSEESIIELKQKAARNVVEYFKTGKPLYPINNISK